MKTPGRLITFIDKAGNVQHGRTYNSDNLVNGKVVVHLLTADLHNIKDDKGLDKKMLVDAGRLTIKGFID